MGVAERSRVRRSWVPRVGRVSRPVMAVVLIATVLVTASVGSDDAPEAEAFFSGPKLVYSLNGDRSDARPLNGAVVPWGSNLAVWVDPLFEASPRVDFDLNGSRWSTERVPPWDFNGTELLGGPTPVWTGDSSFRDGSNTITARIDRWWWRDTVINATFTREPKASSSATVPGLGLDFGAADAVIDGYIRNEKLNGAGLVVVHPDHGIVHESYRGEITPDRISLIASSAKMISAGVLLHLADEGLLDMNAPISDIPGLGWGNVLRGATPAQLLSNSSGIPALIAADAPFFGYSFGNECPIDATRTLLDCGRAIAQNKFDDWFQVDPDTEYRYGGPQWQVAGAIAEQVSGQSWAQLIDEIYVQPCGLGVLGYTTLFQLGYLLSLEPLPYPGGFDGDLGNLVSTRNPTIEGGGYTTPRDYAELLLMLLRGGRCGDTQVLSPEAIELMTTDRIGPAYNGVNDAGLGYGLGWAVNGDIVSDPGLFGAVPWLDLGGGYGAYFVIESVSLPGSSGRTELIDAVKATIANSDLAPDDPLHASAADAALSGAFASDGVGVGAPNGTGVFHAATSSNNSVTFEFDVAEAGYYSMVGSVKAPNGNDDSFWVTVNGTPSTGWLWDTGRFAEYTESTVRHRGDPGPTVVWLDAGINRVGVHHREDGTYIRSMRLVPA